jgi:hypothetical protein
MKKYSSHARFNVTYEQLDSSAQILHRIIILSIFEAEIIFRFFANSTYEPDIYVLLMRVTIFSRRSTYFS